jgi:serine/threonine protein kinase
VVTPTGPTGRSTTTGTVKTGATAAPTSELVFGRYQIIRRLAVGGMGEVFLARQSSVAGFDRLIILKSLLPDLADQKDFVDQFLDEARVAATLNHPNIVSIYEVGQWNGTYFIAMEYIRGDNLSRLQRAAERAKRAIPLDVAAFIIHDAAHALDHAHKATNIHGQAQNIVHRDVSPQNIMVRTDGVTKVVDFGIAKAANRSSRTATGLLKGKVQYMAPEQVSGMELDGRADQFALGVTLWEMIAARKLFTGGNEIEVLKAVIQAPIPPLSSVRADIPPQLAHVVDKMLARDRDARYATLADAAADLKKFLDLAGMKNAQQHTTEFVADMLGAEIDQKTVDLTPSSANNFVINLSSPSTSPTSMHAAGLPRRAKIGIAAGVSVALVLAVLTAAIVFVPPPENPQVGVLPVTPTPGAKPQLAVETQPTGAVVKVDGVEIGKTPVTVDVTPDVEHTVTVDAPGFETRTEKLKLAAGQMKPFVFVLAPKKAKLAVRALLDGAPIAGVEVKSGGKVLGKTPFEIDVPPDAAMALVAGMKRGKETFAGGASAKAAPGETTNVDVKLAKVNVAVACAKGSKRNAATGLCEEIARDTTTSAASTGKGLLTLDTKPWAKLYIDGKYVDSTPLSKFELSAGVHTLRMVNEAAGVDEQRKITIKPGETFKATWQLKTNN